MGRQPASGSNHVANDCLCGALRIGCDISPNEQHCRFRWLRHRVLPEFKVAVSLRRDEALQSVRGLAISGPIPTRLHQCGSKWRFALATLHAQTPEPIKFGALRQKREAYRDPGH